MEGQGDLFELEYLTYRPFNYSKGLLSYHVWEMPALIALNQ